jgi:enoyl-[acyl-carrier-protein] reductase (NADH)
VALVLLVPKYLLKLVPTNFGGSTARALRRTCKMLKGTAVHLLPLDVRDRVSVESAFSSLPADWSNVDILINNAGLSRGLNKLHEGSIQDWKKCSTPTSKVYYTVPDSSYQEWLIVGGVM